MEIAFDTKDLRTLCESERKARGKLGDEVVEQLQHRLADLGAAISLADLSAADLGFRFDDATALCSVDLAQGYEMKLAVNHRDVPRLSSGAVAWAKVERVKVIRIGELQ